MKSKLTHFRRLAARRGKRQHGVALITSLLLLLLLMGITLAMSFSAGSDMMVNNYYGNFRGSFYAADSGMTIARQQMITNLENAVPAAFAPGTAPIPPGTESNIGSAITTQYNSFGSVDQGGAGSSWPETFKITNATVSAPTIDASGAPNTYIYSYPYTLTAVGHASGTENTTLTEGGLLKVTASVVPASSKASFAAWGMFIDQYSICSGGDLVPGNITGPVFTNGAWNFGTGGQYTFTDPVGSVNKNAGYDFGGGGCQQVPDPTTSVTSGGTTIAPKFGGGFNRGANPIPLPTDSFNQKRAVLDGVGNNNTPPTNTDLNTYLRDANGTKYPLAGANTGVYLPYNVDPTTGARTFGGGGIYVEGTTDSIVLSPTGDCGVTTPACAQTYTIKQGANTTVVNIDPNANTTSISVNGAAATSIAGVPMQNNVSPAIPGTMLYANGNITSLSGPGQGLTAIQDKSAVTVTSAANITITGDLLYKQEPVTLTASQTTPIDTLTGNDTKQVLGIFTANGDVKMNNQQSNGNLEIDASIATVATGGQGGLINSGSQIQLLTIVGGRIQNQIKNINTVTRNVLFDRRFLNGNFAPPFFPSTTINTGQSKATFTQYIKRGAWKDVSHQNY
jgi:hypothetical protein